MTGLAAVAVARAHTDAARAEAGRVLAAAAGAIGIRPTARAARVSPATVRRWSVEGTPADRAAVDLAAAAVENARSSRGRLRAAVLEAVTAGVPVAAAARAAGVSRSTAHHWAGGRP